MGAEQDPDDPKAYIEAYQEGLFKKTNTVAIKGGYIVEALEREPDGRIKEVKITNRKIRSYRGFKCNRSK